MKKKLGLSLLCISIVGCDSDSQDKDIGTVIDVVAPIVVESLQSDIAPIGDFSGSPYKVDAIESPQYLEPIFEGMTASYVYTDNAITYSNITESKALRDYVIEPEFNYQYRVRADIWLDSGYCVSFFVVKNKIEAWSGEGATCDYNSRELTTDEAMAAYGMYEVKPGKNFIATFRLAGSVNLEWNIQ